MGLFSKEKKITFDEILAGIEALTPEEKEKLVSKIKGEATPEAPETPEVPETPEAEETTEAPETAPEGEEVETKTPDATPEVEEGLEDPAQEIPEETPTEEHTAEPMDELEKDNTAEMLKSFGDRLSALEATINELNGLKASMEEYVNKQKESFGFKSNGGAGSHKDFQDMSAAELKQHILKN
jgi:hypothetical protein